jgi:hypothetical protein
MNLISNAAEAMEATQGGIQYIETLPDQNKVVVLVRDTGVGVSKSTIPRLFDPFFPPKPKAKVWGSVYPWSTALSSSTAVPFMSVQSRGRGQLSGSVCLYASQKTSMHNVLH